MDKSFKNENWTAPNKFPLRKSISLIDEIAENIKISSTSFWTKGNSD